MKKRFTLLAALFLFLITSLFSQHTLKIFDPDGWDTDGVYGTIEEATITVEPKGAYFEINLYLTFSAEGSYYSSFDNLEIALDFNLPEGSIIHDSWLWLPDGETIVKADVYDIRNATNIYEDIVDRASDPSILYKKEDGGYQLRVFPLQGGENRRVKLSYLSPAIWNEHTVETWLPNQIFTNSIVPLSSVKILTIPDPNWLSPQLVSTNEMVLNPMNIAPFGAVEGIDLPAQYFEKPLKFSVKSPLTDGNVFVNKYQDGEDHFYQLAYMPPEVNQVNPRKILLLFDHESDNSDISKLGLFEYVKATLKQELTPQDSFNIIFSKTGGNLQVSPSWIPGSESDINQALNSLLNPIENYSNMSSLLTEGIDFIKNNGGEGDIVLIANSDNLNYTAGNNLSQQLLSEIEGENIRFNIINYQNRNYYYNMNWTGIQSVGYSHMYFYRDLVVGSSGILYSNFKGGLNVWENISALLSDLSVGNYNFDFDISLNSGFTFQDFFQNYMGQSRVPNKAIVATGKYTGSFPLTVDYIGISDNGFVTDSKTLDESAIILADTLSREIWYGNYFRYLEGIANSGNDEAEVVHLSKTERVLSKYTAFLALDLENGGEPCLDCWGYPLLTVETNDPDQNGGQKIHVTASPNPFSINCSIELELTGQLEEEEIQIQIFDAFGKLVATIDAEPLIQHGKLQWNWDARDQTGNSVPAGVYMLTVRSNNDLQTIKLVYTR